MPAVDDFFQHLPGVSVVLYRAIEHRCNRKLGHLLGFCWAGVKCITRILKNSTCLLCFHPIFKARKFVSFNKNTFLCPSPKNRIYLTKLQGK